MLLSLHLDIRYLFRMVDNRLCIFVAFYCFSSAKLPTSNYRKATPSMDLFRFEIFYFPFLILVKYFVIDKRGCNRFLFFHVNSVEK